MRTKTGFDKEDVLDVELDLTGYCNLNCPLCANNYAELKYKKIKHIRPLSDWIKQLEEYVNLKSVCLAGIVSEPTLYPELFGLLDYLTNRSISVELYTNASLYKAEYWKELANHLTNRDLVFFTICGSTQSVHERYRVGSKLSDVINNSRAFREASKYNNDVIQHIMFEYNKEDFINMNSIIREFSSSFLIHSLPYQERFKVLEDPTNICMVKDRGDVYNAIKKRVLTRRNNNDVFLEIGCKSLQTHFIAIDNQGNIFPCFLYRMYSTDAFDHKDYSKILKFAYEFCYECEKTTTKLLESNCMERMA